MANQLRIASGYQPRLLSLPTLFVFLVVCGNSLALSDKAWSKVCLQHVCMDGSFTERVRCCDAFPIGEREIIYGTLGYHDYLDTIHDAWNAFWANIPSVPAFDLSFMKTGPLCSGTVPWDERFYVFVDLQVLDRSETCPRGHNCLAKPTWVERGSTTRDSCVITLSTDNYEKVLRFNKEHSNREWAFMPYGEMLDVKTFVSSSQPRTVTRQYDELVVAKKTLARTMTGALTHIPPKGSTVGYARTRAGLGLDRGVGYFLKVDNETVWCTTAHVNPEVIFHPKNGFFHPGRQINITSANNPDFLCFFTETPTDDDYPVYEIGKPNSRACVIKAVDQDPNGLLIKREIPIVIESRFNMPGVGEVFSASSADTIASGMSGSPCVDERGEIVGHLVGNYKWSGRFVLADVTSQRFQEALSQGVEKFLDLHAAKAGRPVNVGKPNFNGGAITVEQDPDTFLAALATDKRIFVHKSDFEGREKGKTYCIVETHVHDLASLSVQSQVLLLKHPAAHLVLLECDATAGSYVVGIGFEGWLTQTKQGYKVGALTIDEKMGRWVAGVMHWLAPIVRDVFHEAFEGSVVTCNATRGENNYVVLGDLVHVIEDMDKYPDAVLFELSLHIDFMCSGGPDAAAEGIGRYKTALPLSDDLVIYQFVEKVSTTHYTALRRKEPPLDSKSPSFVIADHVQKSRHARRHELEVGENDGG